MAMIPETDKADLKRRLRKELKKDVIINLFTTTPTVLTIPGRECPTCPQTQELMEDLASLSPKLHLKTYDFFSQIQEREEYGVEQIPAIVMEVNGGPRLSFYGLPGGYEFAAFLDVLNNLSREVSPLSSDTRRKLRRVNRPVHIQVFVTPSCQYCPVMVRMAQAMAVENKLIKVDVVEVQEFPSLARRHNVASVPKTVINDVVQLMGVQPEDQMLEKVMEVGYQEPEPKSGGKATRDARV